MVAITTSNYDMNSPTDILRFSPMVESVTQDLQQIRNVFRSAYKGSSGFSSHKTVNELLSKYQMLLANTIYICSNSNLFQNAYECHQLALKHLKTGDLESVLTKIKDSNTLKESLVSSYQQIFKESTSLADESKKMVLSTLDDTYPIHTRLEDLKKKETSDEGLLPADSQHKKTLETSLSSLNMAVQAAGAIQTIITRAGRCCVNSCG